MICLAQKYPAVELSLSQCVQFVGNVFIADDANIISTFYVYWDRDILISNNHFIGGENAISLRAKPNDPATGTVITKNHFEGQTGSAIYLSNHASPLITSNNSEAGNIYLGNTDGPGQVIGNSIRAKNTGIMLNNCDGDETGNFLVANNFVSLSKGDYSTNQGIYAYNCSKVDLVYNSVLGQR